MRLKAVYLLYHILWVTVLKIDQQTLVVWGT